MKNFSVMMLLLTVGNGFAAESAQVAVQQLFTQEEFQTYCAAREFTKVLVAAKEAMHEKHNELISFEGLRIPTVEGLWPTINTIEQGLVVEFFKGSPCCMYTPWGQWAFKSSDKTFCKKDSEKTIKELYIAQLEKLGVKLTLHASAKDECALYAVEEIKKIIIPNLIIIMSTRPISQEEILIREQRWQAMTQKYEAEKSKKRVEVVI